MGCSSDYFWSQHPGYIGSRRLNPASPGVEGRPRSIGGGLAGISPKRVASRSGVLADGRAEGQLGGAESGEMGVGSRPGKPSSEDPKWFAEGKDP
ncbi:unnamed protein product [Boreogadus saida]